MRKSRMTCLLLCICLLLSACSATTGETLATDELFDNTYTVKYDELPEKMELSNAQYSDGEAIYLCGLDLNDKPVIGQYTEMGFLEYKLPDEISYAFACCLAEQEVSIIAGDYPANWVNARGEYVQNTQDMYNLYLLNYDRAGTLKAQIPIDIHQGITIRSIRYLNGYYYVMSATELSQLDQEGRLLNTMHLDGGSFISQTITGDHLAVCHFDSVSDGGGDCTKILVLDSAETFTFRTLLSDEHMTVYGIGASDDGRILINADNVIYQMSPETGEWNTFFNFYAGGELVTDYSDIYPCQGFYLLASTRQEKLVSLAARGEEEKTELVLWTYYADANLNELVSGFNQSNDQYRIRVETAQDLGEEQINAKIAANKGPDLFSTGQNGFASFDGKTIFEDLTPFINNSETLGWENIIAPLTAAMRDENKLYSIPVSFTIYTVLYRTDLLTDAEMSLKDMQSLPEIQNGDIRIFPSYYTRSEVWDWLSNLYLCRYLNKENGSCNFKTEVFTQSLTLCAGLTEEWSVDDTPCVFSIEQIPGTLRLLYLQQSYGDSFSLNTSLGSAFVVDLALAISAASSHKDGAWEFIEYVYSTDLDNERFSLPASAERLDALLNKACTYGVWDDEFHEYQQLNDSTVTAFWEVIENTHGILGNMELIDIMKEEAEKYFSGDRNMEDTVDVIQSRANIFLAEKYG